MRRVVAFALATVEASGASVANAQVAIVTLATAGWLAAPRPRRVDLCDRGRWRAGREGNRLRWVRLAPFTKHRLRTPSGQDVDLSALMNGGGSVVIRVAR